MKMLVDGVWRTEGDYAHDPGGRFVRAETQFRDWITADGAPGPAGEGGFKAEPGRYRLYVSLACPWAHRTLIFRKLKGLERIVGLSVVNWLWGEEGWTFTPGRGVVADPVLGAEKLHQIYTASDPHYTGRCSVPVLFDVQRRRIVNNESSEIIRMFNSAFDGVGAAHGDFYPAELSEEIDALNARIYPTVNNGVYRCGFARSQQAYDEAVVALFESLDWLEARLAERRYLTGERATEADWRLFTTLVRFDLVYVGLFKCNVRRIADYPNLSRYLGQLRAWPGVEETIDAFHIKHHYYESLKFINPTGIVPQGPAGLD
jgi:putative glutathione S-transferase